MSLRIIEFWTDFRPARDGSEMRPIDMVAYAPIGQADRSITVEMVSTLGKVVPLSTAPDNPAVKLANERWDVIGPAYKAWKAGEDLEVDGTPLAAWPGISPSQARGLQAIGIRSVEEVAGMTDAIINRVPFPGARVLKESAAAFLHSFDKTRTAAEITQLNEQNQILKDELAELRQMMQQKVADDPAPKRRGRPAKVDTAGDEVAA